MCAHKYKFLLVGFLASRSCQPIHTQQVPQGEEFLYEVHLMLGQG